VEEKMRRLFTALLSLGFTLLAMLICIYMYMYLHLPDVHTLNNAQMQVPLRVYSEDGKLIAEFGDERRSPVTIDKVPKDLIWAILATEDQRYFEHPGVDLIGLVRASIAVIASGRKSQGASTITMQVARNFFLTSQKTYSRKINEMLLAIKIETTFSKRKILELYLNKIYLGHRAYGVAAASELYFGKPLKELTLAQLAMIAGLPQAPSRDNPINNPEAARERRNHVLLRMLENGHIKKAAYKVAVAEPMTAHYHDQTIALSAPYIAEMVRATVVDVYGKEAYSSGLKVYTTVNSKFQTAANNAIYNGLMGYEKRHGYYGALENWGQPKAKKMDTWQDQLDDLESYQDLLPAAILDVNAQSATALLGNGDRITIPWAGLSWARPNIDDEHVGPLPASPYDVVKLGDVVYVRYTGKFWELTQLPEIEGALVALNPKNGAILSLVGGFSHHRSNFNRATQAERQPGSSFKPFVYSAALAHGFTLASIINDAPLVFVDKSREDELWRPQNDNQKFYGPMRLRAALTKSRNLVSIRILNTIGLRYAINYLHRFGFTDADLPRSLTLALGAGSVTPLQLATGYSIFANGGYRVKPYFIDHIERDNGEQVYRENPFTVCEDCLVDEEDSTSTKISEDSTKKGADSGKILPAPRVITPQNAYLITSVLQDVITKGTARRAIALNRSDIAGKTGTTNNQFDAWFAGYNQEVVATVWVGYDQPSSVYEFGGELALPIWMEFMQVALAGKPDLKWDQPAGIVTVRIDPHTGLLAYPGQRDSMFEKFMEENAPADQASASQQPRDASAGTASEAEHLF
jgi:penicillin-binding protein 1A